MSSETDLIKSNLTDFINRHCLENRSNTPDHILAEVMWDALVAFENASRAREEWYGQALSINQGDATWVGVGE